MQSRRLGKGPNKNVYDIEAVHKLITRISQRLGPQSNTRETTTIRAGDIV